MKKTPLSSRSSSSSTSRDIKTKNVSEKKAKTNTLGSSSVTRTSKKDESSSSQSVTGVDTQTSTLIVKDRQTRKYTQELELLKKENEELKAELLFIKSLYSQLVEEIPSEKFDERRVILLKSQVIQLERQVLLQSNALSARVNVLLEVENRLSKMRETLRSALPSEDLTGCVTIPCEYLNNLMSVVDGTRSLLLKSAENGEMDNLSLPVVFMGSFLRQSNRDVDNVVTLMDICSGKVDHLNLKHVSRLESKLCKLYKNMICLKETLQQQSSPTTLISQHIAQPIRDRLASHVTAVTDMLKDCSEDLLSLSVLCPAAPWPPLKKVFNKDLSEEIIMSHMPDTNRKKQQEIQSVVQALMKSVNYSKHMMSLEIKILKEELSFHQKVYECQVNSAENLLSAVSEAYRQFEGNFTELLCNPLEEILIVYSELKDAASEDGLRQFLLKFKDHAGQLSDALKSLDSHKQEESEGTSALSQFQTHFLDSLSSLTRQCVAKRDILMRQLLDAKDSGLHETTASSNSGALNTSNHEKSLKLTQDQRHNTP